MEMRPGLACHCGLLPLYFSSPLLHIDVCLGAGDLGSRELGFVFHGKLSSRPMSLSLDLPVISPGWRVRAETQGDAVKSEFLSWTCYRVMMRTCPSEIQ